MRVAIGADHAGVVLKDTIRQRLETQGVEVKDFGTHSTASVDYPDIAAAVAKAVAGGEFDRGILVCGTGIGMAMAANKIHGIRAAAVVDETSARMSREHNDANVLALAGRITPPEQAGHFVDIFLDTPFSGGRHQSRVDKITALEHEDS
jgi:ribose 5-phosphate isomerase B